MKIDEKVLEAVARALAPRTWDVLDTVKEGSPIEREIAPQIRKSVEDARTAIEAYEAARPEPNPWRPIEEAPRDGTKICVWWAAGKGQFGHYPETMEFLWWERDCWLSDLGGRALNHDGCVKVGAMFRTIDPPSKP